MIDDTKQSRSGEVVHAFPGLPINPLQVEPLHDHNYCHHDAIRIIRHERQIVCAQCARVLDPFAYLETNARTIQQAWESHRQVSNQVRELGERLHAMKKEEARLRAKLKRLQEKDGDVTVIRGRDRL
jgi:hypothetical protein